MAVGEEAAVPVPTTGQKQLPPSTSLERPLLTGWDEDGHLDLMTVLGWDKSQQVGHSLVRIKTDHSLMQYLKST